MSGEERSRIRERAMKFDKLSDREKEDLKRRAAAFQVLLQRALAGLSDAERHRLDELSPVVRRREEQALVRKIMAKDDRSLERESLPKTIQEQWPDLSPEERRQHRKEVRKRKKRANLEMFLGKAVQKGDLSEAERSRILALPRRSQQERMREIRQAADGRFLDRLVERGRLSEERREEIARLDGVAQRMAVEEVRKRDFLVLNREFRDGLPEFAIGRLLREPPQVFYSRFKQMVIDHSPDRFDELTEAERRRFFRLPAPQFFKELRKR